MSGNGRFEEHYCKYGEPDQLSIKEMTETVDKLVLSLNQSNETLTKYGSILLESAMQRDSIPIKSHNVILLTVIAMMGGIKLLEFILKP